MLPVSNPFKLAVFGCNVSHGCTISTAAGGIAVDWSESVRLAQFADELGVEAFIPVCRWKGFGGPSSFNHRSFETYTWAAGLAQATQRLHVFATTAVPAMHPVLAAKQGVTVDHISGGRFGLNIVAGWNRDEVQMFGQTQLPHAARYELAREWVQFLCRLWTEDGEFSVEGEYFNAERVYAEPKPLQRPRPPIMSAGVSAAGRRFAAEYADMSFILAPDLEAAGETAADIRGLARSQFGRDVAVWGNAAVFCRPSHAEAEDYYRYIVDQLGDREAAGNLLDTFTVESESQLPDAALREAYLRNMMAGYSGFPVIGTPDEVVAFFAAMHERGLAGTSLSWPDYDEGLAQLGEEILPRMVERGLRRPASDAA